MMNLSVQEMFILDILMSEGYAVNVGSRSIEISKDDFKKKIAKNQLEQAVSELKLDGIEIYTF